MAKTTSVKGHVRRNGQYVKPHWRSINKLGSGYVGTDGTFHRYNRDQEGNIKSRAYYSKSKKLKYRERDMRF